MKSAIIAATALACAAAPALAQQAPQTRRLSSADQTFLTQAVQGNAAEASLGELAAQKATQPAVQEFGRWMHTDHTLANQQLMAVARALHRTPPSPQPNTEQQSEAQALQQVSGSQFDQQYIEHMVSDHQKDVQDYQKEADSSQNRFLKAYATSMLPVIQAHLAEAQQLASMNPGSQAAVSGSTATAPASTAK